MKEHPKEMHVPATRVDQSQEQTKLQQLTVEDIEKIKDPEERRQAISENMHLFE